LRYGKKPVCPKCELPTTFYRIKARATSFTCKWCGYHLHPLKGTIFAGSSTPLSLWFHALFLFSVSKNGVSAKELERHLGVSYPTALRIGRQIRMLFSEEDKGLLGGTMEADETYVGGKARGTKNRYKNKTMVLGVVEREGGRARTKIVENARASTVVPFLKENVDTSAFLYTDESHMYKSIHKEGYTNERVNHSAYEWARGDMHTNSMEGFWSQVKRSLHGTHHAVSKKHLQSYLDEFTWKWSHRYDDEPVFKSLLRLAAKPLSGKGKQPP
jgi:transposase-like protein